MMADYEAMEDDEQAYFAEKKVEKERDEWREQAEKSATALGYAVDMLRTDDGVSTRSFRERLEEYRIFKKKHPC